MNTKIILLSLKDWENNIEGIYTFQISSAFWYEIHILVCNKDYIIASSYEVHWQYNENEFELFEFKRHCLLKEKSLDECLEDIKNRINNPN